MRTVYRIEYAAEDGQSHLAPLDGHGIDADFLKWTVLRVTGRLRDLLYDVVAFGDFAEDAVFVVQPGCRGNGDEELAPIGIWARVGHGEKAGLRVFQLRMEFIGELITRTAASGAFRIAALNHEIGDDAVENGSVVKRLSGLLSFGQRNKIVDR